MLRLLEVRLPSYKRKHIFAGFAITLTTYASLFLEHWRLFCVDWRYVCQDIGENIYYPAFKLGLLH